MAEVSSFDQRLREIESLMQFINDTNRMRQWYDTVARSWIDTTMIHDSILAEYVDHRLAVPEGL